MTSITEPSKFVTPFAESGLKNTIPPASNNTTGKAGFDKGFPERTMLPKASGGIPPSGMDFNGILYDITSAIRYMQAGGKPTYDAAFAATIGGYPSGAVLIGDDGVSVFQNAVAGNETDPNSGGAGWTRPDLQVMELYRRSYAEAGYNVVGTFQAGFTLVNANDVGIDLATGKGYTGPAGTVAAGTDPASGGVVDVSAVLKNTFAGTPDYTGVPLYDGSDQTRITATDNSPLLAAVMDNGAVSDGVLTIHFPSGHFGFKTEIARTATSHYHTIVFKGAGKGATILDFIKERTDTIGVNVQPAQASVLLRLTGFKRVVYEDLSAKCTTKMGTIDGSTDPSASNPSVYYGAVWFAHHQDCDNVRFDGIDVTKCNYRGMSIDASGKLLGARTKVAIINSDGFDNTSTGYWLSYCNSLFVSGGEYYHNGTLGLLATGYGIAASQYVDTVLVVGGAHFYENYRKGFDRHGGVGNMTFNGCVFADNLLRDVEDNKQYNDQYPAGLQNNNYFTACDFFLNRNTEWLVDALQPVAGNASAIKGFVSTLDRTIAGALANRQGECKFTACSFRVIGDIPDGYKAFNGFSIESLETEFDNTSVDTSGFRFANGTTGDVYSSWFFNSPHDNAVLRFKNSSVKTHSGKIINSSNSQLSNGVFLLSLGTATLELENSNLDLLDFVLTGVSGAGGVSANQCKRLFNNSGIRFRDLKQTTHNNSFSNAFSWLNSGFGLRSGSSDERIEECTIAVGSAKPSPVSISGATGKVSAFQVPAQSKAVGAEFEILTGVMDGDVFAELEGALELNADKYRAGWRFSSWTHSVYTGSSYVGMERTGTKAVKLYGVDTNFIATRLRVFWVVASPGSTGWYNGKISAANPYLPALISQ